MSGSRIDEIVDAVAAAAANVGTPPVAAVWGAGSGLIDDPLRPGQKVQSGIPGFNPISRYSWFVLPPPSTGWEYGDATSTEITWRVEGRLYVPKNDLAEAYKSITGGFINALAKKFTATSTGSPTLSDVCAEQHIVGTNFGMEGPEWAWLSVVLSVREIVNLNA